MHTVAVAPVTAPRCRPTRCCVACGETATTPLYRELARCAGCGLVYFPPALAAADVQRLYGEDYFHGAEYWNYAADRPVHEANFRARLRQLQPWLPPGRRLFEVGCSYGFFLHLAQVHWQVAGCDIAEAPVCHAREVLHLDVQCGDFAGVPLGRGDVDAFCLWDTIEHLDDPGLYLARMADVLAPGGVVALTTGDIGSWLARWQGPRWRQIHPPTHLWYFSRPTLERTLARFGFEVCLVRHVGLARSLGQILYSLTSLGRPTPSRLHRLVMATGLGHWRVWLNTFDLMLVIARRR